MKNFWLGFVYAGRGLLAGIRGQRNIKVMLGSAVVVVVGGVWLRVPRGEWALLTLAMGLVLALELLNTAGEQLLDRIHPEPDEQVGRIKDIMAGAVLLAATTSAVVGGLVFWPRLF
jgi:diacylglycerol kinase